MPGKCRPSLRDKTLENVMRSSLSSTDKKCIKAVFERYEVEKRLNDLDYADGKLEEAFKRIIER